MPHTDPFYSEFISYWRTLADEAGGVPLRVDFKPTKIPKLLSNIYIIERGDDRKCKVRLAGSGLDEATDYQFKPADIFDRFKEADWDLYNEYLETLFGAQCGSYGVRRYHLKNRKIYDAQSVTLPLRGRNEENYYTIGLMRLEYNFMADIFEDAPKENVSQITDFEFFDAGYGLPPHNNNVHAKLTSIRR